MRKVLLYFLLVAVISIAASLFFIYYVKNDNVSADSQNVLPAKAEIGRIIDGDTFTLADGSKIRLIGIDSPEKGQRLYDEAKQYLNELIAGKTVLLEYDKGTRDRYGRILAYVYVEDSFINGKMAESGWASLLTIKPNTKYAKELKRLSDNARHARLGIWGLGEDAEYIYDPKSVFFHRTDCPRVKNIMKHNQKRAHSRNEALKKSLRPCRKCNA